MTFYKMILEDIDCPSAKAFITHNFGKEIRERCSQFFYKEGENRPKAIYIKANDRTVAKSIEKRFRVVEMPKKEMMDCFFLDNDWKTIGEGEIINVSF